MNEVFALEFFFFHLKKNWIKNKVISININCSNCWPLSCSPYWKIIKSTLFGGSSDKGYYGNILNVAYIGKIRKKIKVIIHSFYFLTEISIWNYTVKVEYVVKFWNARHGSSLIDFKSFAFHLWALSEKRFTCTSLIFIKRS